ncbi:MAG TPA: hypothetical protein PKH07_16290, partial [bacterium]|nr:hypothetical protein [bacterium]
NEFVTALGQMYLHEPQTIMAEVDRKGKQESGYGQHFPENRRRKTAGPGAPVKQRSDRSGAGKNRPRSALRKGAGVGPR